MKPLPQVDNQAEAETTPYLELLGRKGSLWDEKIAEYSGSDQWFRQQWSKPGSRGFP